MYGNILVIAIHIFVTIAFFLFPAMWVHGVCPMGMGNKYKGNRLCISCSFVPESLCSLTSNFLSFYSCTKDQVGLHQEVRQVKQFAQYSLSWGERWALRCYTTRYGEHADSRFCLGSLCMMGSSSRTENHCFQWPHLCASVQVPVPGGVGASALYSCTKGATGTEISRWDSELSTRNFWEAFRYHFSLIRHQTSWVLCNSISSNKLFL